jgi:hypothetical protein
MNSRGRGLPDCVMEEICDESIDRMRDELEKALLTVNGEKRRPIVKLTLQEKKL